MKGNCLFILLSLILGMATAGAQGGSQISGSVFDQSGEALSFSTVALYHQSDSTLARAEYTDTEGAFQLSGVGSGRYYMHISYVGIPSMILRDIEVEPGRDLDLGEVVMNSEGMDLSEVVVTTTKPLIEVRADKTVFNVEASITAAGSDGWELLRKAPGVMIDNNDQIQIRGKSGVLIQIDGKDTYLTQEELANLLRSVDASDIDRIEVITNPSARYEASGNSGIINIVMKVSKGLGTNGSLSLSGAYGKQYRAYSSVNLNHRAERFNIYGSIGGGHSRWENGLNLYRLQNDRIFDQKQVQVGKSTPINTRLGMDLYISPKHTLGIMGNVNTHIGDSDMESYSRTVISPQSNPGAVDSILVAENLTDRDRINTTFNINYRFLDSDQGVEWSVDADRGYYENQSSSFQPNTYWNEEETQVISRRDFRTVSPSEINIFSVKTDFEKRFNELGKLSTGLKWTAVETDNEFNFFNVAASGEEILDVHQSNHFVYDERVSAAYVNFQSKLSESIDFQAGVRMEHTQSTGDLTRHPSLPVSPDDLVEREYTDWFPSASITWQLHSDHNLNATYSRRINRPNYQQLNPFEWRIDELTFRKGSLFLSPYYSNSFELKYLAFKMFNISAGYTKTDDLITDLVEASQTEPNRSFINYRNLARQDHYFVGINAPTPIKSWWNGYVNINIYKSKYQADFPEYQFDASTPIAYNIYAEQTFRVSNSTVLEVSGWYNSPTIWGGGWVTDPQGSLNLGIQQRLFDGRATAKLSFTDVLNTAPWSNTGDIIPNLVVHANGYWDSRQVRLNFNYRFGSTEVKSARQRKTGIEAETQRIDE